MSQTQRQGMRQLASEKKRDEFSGNRDTEQSGFQIIKWEAR